MNKITDKEVIDVMKQGGKRIVAEAKAKWHSSKYTLGETDVAENIKRWELISNRVDEIANNWKE